MTKRLASFFASTRKSQVALTWVGWPNSEKLASTVRPGLACKFDLDQSERKSSPVNASGHKAWPNGVVSRLKFSTCVYLRVRLARALHIEPRELDCHVIVPARSVRALFALRVRELFKVLYITSFGLKMEKRNTRQCSGSTDEEQQGVKSYKNLAK